MIRLVALCGGLLVLGCAGWVCAAHCAKTCANSRHKPTGVMSVSQREFGQLPDGTTVTCFTLKNDKGSVVDIIDYGATITSIRVADKSGNVGEVTLGFKDIDGYLSSSNPYFGATIGRVANRIGGASFSLEGKDYPLHANNGANTLHGGKKGFDKVMWKASTESDRLTMRYVSPDMEEGFPGELTTEVTFALSADNALSIDYKVQTAQTTIQNLTNHTYFNLAGPASGSVENHVAESSAAEYTPTTEDSIPTGEIVTVKGTPFDFTTPKRVGDRIRDISVGYDHNYVISRTHRSEVEKTQDLPMVFRVSEPTTGRVLEVFTTEPGVQFYTGFYLDGFTGREDKPYEQFGGFCLETQNFPDAIHQSNFPSCVIKPGETYTSRTVYKFATQAE
eukprot:m.278963 g.278963  ORF g.278963 m.278963 type:complete len:391 (-) comp11102_c2_seq11:28-1200(-)